MRYGDFDDPAELYRDIDRVVPMLPATAAALPVFAKLAQWALAGDASAGRALDRFARLVYLQDLAIEMADRRASIQAYQAAQENNA